MVQRSESLQIVAIKYVMHGHGLHIHRRPQILYVLLAKTPLQ